MNKLPKISVIIPAYNAHETICAAIQSVLDTGYPNLEIIVSDDASGKPYDLSAYPGVTVLRSEENRGAGVARQRALTKAAGVWLVFLDADDLIYKNLFDVFYSGSAVAEDIISCCIEHGEVMLDNATEWTTHGKIYRKSFLERNRIVFDPEIRIYEDMYFNRLAFAVAKKQNGIRYNGDVCWNLTVNPKSVTRRVDNWLEVTEFENMDANLRLMERYCDLFRDEYVGTVNMWRRRVEHKGDRQKWFRLFDSVKRMFGTEDYSTYCDILGAALHGEEEIYREWTESFPSVILSVIIPLYNSHKYIADTVEKLYQIINSDDIWAGHVEVLLTDDRSDVPDYSYLHGKNLRVLYNGENVRMGENRNRALRMAKGRWVTFLDHDDEITEALLDAVFNAGDETCILKGRTRNVTGAPDDCKDYECADLVHGVVYRRTFLGKNDIWFSGKVKTSEDSYFNRRAAVTARYLYGVASVVDCEAVFYHWIWREDSAFFSHYNGREYSEEFYHEYVKALLMAYDCGFIPDSFRNATYVWMLHNAEHNLKRFEASSANFKKANIKVLCSFLIFLRDKAGITRENFYDFLTAHDKEYKRQYPGDYVWMNEGHDMKYSMFCFDMLDKLSEEWKEKIRGILVW